MFADDDDMVECPYNNSHRMLRKRLQSHLLKCRIHYPNVELRKCPFNMTHLIPEPEFTHHVTNCSDRKLITQYKYDAPEPKEEEKPQHAPIESEENWDETDAADYDPIKHVETANVIRRPNGPTPSERKEFIKKERIRLGDADSDEDIDGNDDAIRISNDDSRERLRSRSSLTSRFSRDRSPMRPYRNRSPDHDVVHIPNDDSCERLRSRSPLTNRYQRSSRDRSPLRSYRNRSPDDVMDIPNDYSRKRLANNYKGFAKDRSPTNHQRFPRNRSPARTYRNPSPEHWRPSHDNRTYNSNVEARNSQSYRDRSPNRHSTANDKRSYSKNHEDRNHYIHPSQRNERRT